MEKNLLYLFFILVYRVQYRESVEPPTRERMRTSGAPRRTGPMHLDGGHGQDMERDAKGNLVAVNHTMASPAAGQYTDEFTIPIGALEYAKSQKVKDVYAENINEPYWFEGHWVYFRTTPEPYKRKPLPPHRTTQNLTSVSTTSTTTTKPANRTTKYIDYFCQHPCPSVFEDYGEVCGTRFQGSDYEIKQFRDLCDMYGENCINPYIKIKGWVKRYFWFISTSYWEDPRRGPWRALYRGPCHELTTEIAYSPTRLNLILSRAQYNNDRMQTANHHRTVAESKLNKFMGMNASGFGKERGTKAKKKKKSK